MRLRGVSGLAAAILAAAILSGCAPSPDIDAQTSSSLQASVVSIADAAADDPASALALLDALAAEVDAAVAQGEITEDRATQIDEAIAAVRTDLQAAVDAVTSSDPTPSEETDSADTSDESSGNKGGNGKDKSNSGKGND